MSMPSYDWLSLAKDAKAALTILAVVFAALVVTLLTYVETSAR